MIIYKINLNKTKKKKKRATNLQFLLNFDENLREIVNFKDILYRNLKV